MKDTTTIVAGQPARESDPPPEFRSAPREQREDLTCDVALQNPDDLAFAFTFGGPSGDVGLGSWIRPHPGHRDPPQRMVRLTITAAVEPVAGDLA